MSLSDLDSLVTPEAEEPSHATNLLLAEFGADRGRALARLAQGLPREPGHQPSDTTLVLRAVADAIIQGD